MHDDPKARLIEITPAMAAEWLEHRNPGNRPIRESIVSFYAEEMKASRFMVTDTGIGIDWDGNLINGQHRLRACIMAQVPFKTWVIEGLDPRSQAVMDTGIKRKASDALHFAGYERPGYLATAARLVYLHERQKLHAAHAYVVSIFDIQQVVERCGGQLKEAMEFVVAAKLNGVLAPGLATFCMYIFSRQNKEKACSFMTALATGLDLRKDDPCYWLRERLMRAGLKRMNKSLPFIFKAWIFHREGAPLKCLKVMPSEEWWDLSRNASPQRPPADKSIVAPAEAA